MDFMLGLLESHATRLAQAPRILLPERSRLGWAKFKKYCTLTDVSPVYHTAVLLRPAHKWEDFEEKWAEHLRWIKDAKMVVKELWQLYKQKFAKDTLLEDQDDSPELSEFDSFLKLTGKRGLADEYDRYCTLPPYDTMKNPLEWWRDYEKAFPSVSRLAFYLSSTPGMAS